jgi:hypothetical protein
LPISNKHVVYAFLIMLIVPISSFFLYNGTPIDPGLLTGMVAGSSILLAFQFTFLSKELDKLYKGENSEFIRTLFLIMLIGFCGLLIGVLLIFYNALGIIPRVIALDSLVFSFEINFLFTFVLCAGFLFDKNK